MNWQTDLRSRSGIVAAVLPPVLVEETAWDILLALHSHDASNPSIDKLASIVSVQLATLTRWLSQLEARQLITGQYVGPTEELRAVLTPAGRDLIDQYLSITSDLRLGASL